MSLFVLISCSESDDSVPEKETTYKLDLSAEVASQGETTFTEIKFKNAQGEIVTLTDVTTTFSESFFITNGFNIYIEVDGTNDGPVSPDVSIGYEVKEVVNGVEVGIACLGFNTNKAGTSGSWTFSADKDVTFNITSAGVTCR